MKLTNRERAIVEEAKIVGYLLSATHPRSQHKAAFFRRFGFREDQSHLLANAFRAHCQQYEVASVRDSRHGTLYTVQGERDTPSGRKALVRSVWFIEAGSDIPRLVTAYPLGRRRR
jgi:hypothetical protein